MLNRDVLQSLAQTRADDSLVLLSNQRWSGAYYVAGYAVELALKACIARLFRPNAIPELELVKSIYTHDPAKLAKVAGLSQPAQGAAPGPLGRHAQANGTFAANWRIVTQWSEASRYEVIDGSKAAELVAAVVGSEGGVLPWLKTYW